MDNEMLGILKEMGFDPDGAHMQKMTILLYSKYSGGYKGNVSIRLLTVDTSVMENIEEECTEVALKRADELLLESRGKFTDAEIFFGDNTSSIIEKLDELNGKKKWPGKK